MVVKLLLIMLVGIMAFADASCQKKEELSEDQIALNLPENYAHLYFYSMRRLPVLRELCNREACSCYDCKLMRTCAIFAKNKYWPYCEGRKPKNCWLCIRKSVCGCQKTPRLF